MIDYVVLLLGIVSTAGLLSILGSAVINGANRGEIERAGALLAVLAYAIAELVPSRFLTAGSAIGLASSVLTLALLVLGLGLLFGQSVLHRGA
jgi:hypothetical protein